MIEAIVGTPHFSPAHAGAGRCGSARRPERGFTLLEAVVVVAVLGIIVALGSQQIMKSLQRTAIDKASNDLRLLFQRALTEMQRRGVVTFIRVGPQASSMVRIKLIADTAPGPTGDGRLQDPTDGGLGPFDTIVDSIDIPTSGSRTVALSSVNKDQIEADRWLYDSASITPDWADYTKTDITKDRLLLCDFQGRATRADTGQQIDRAATLRITHVNILSGTLQPPVRYELHINPAWNVKVERQIKNSAGTWVVSAGGA